MVLICAVIALSFSMHAAHGAVEMVNVPARTKGVVTEASTSGQEVTITLPGGVPLVLIYCPAGKFQMGCVPGEQDSYFYEDYQHQVTLTKDFYMGKYVVTKRQWTAVMGTTPWSGQSNVLDDPESPAIYVSWNDIAGSGGFIEKLNQHLASTGQTATVRLPTEPEWEYACRAGTTTRFYWGDDSSYSLIGNYARYNNNTYYAGEQYAPVVGSKLPNAWGLYDMSGNVWEWCQDWYEDNYASDSVTDPIGPVSGVTRVLRGGSWSAGAGSCRSATRNYAAPAFPYSHIGFRLAQTATLTLSDLDGEPYVSSLDVTDEATVRVNVATASPVDALIVSEDDFQTSRTIPFSTTFNFTFSNTVDGRKTLWVMAVKDGLTGPVIQAGIWLRTLKESQAVDLGQETPGWIFTPGEVDPWRFIGRAGHMVTVVVNPQAPYAPYLNRARVALFAPDGSTLATGESPADGQAAALRNITLPADGIYRINVSAATSLPNATGNYTITVYDVTPHDYELVLNTRHSGTLTAPFALDRWRFSASAQNQVRLKHLGASGGSVLYRLTGPSGWVGFGELTGDSELIILPATGQYCLEVTAQGGQGGIAYAFMMEQTAVIDLTPGNPYTGQWAGTGQAWLFRIHLAKAAPLHLTFTDASSDNRAALYLRHGAPPTRRDFKQQASGAGPKLTILEPMATMGDWYVLLYGDYCPTPSSFTMLAESQPLLVNGVTPASYGNGQQATLTIQGAGFSADCQVSLVQGATVFEPASTDIISSEKIDAVFDLTPVPAGQYQIRVNRGAELAQAPFEVVAGGAAKLETNLIVPSAVGRHAPAEIYIEYSNVGTAAMPAPLLVLTGTERPIMHILEMGSLLPLNERVQGFFTETMPSGWGNSVQFLASGQRAGILQPGEHGRITVAYAGLQTPWSWAPNVQFSLGVIDAKSTATVDWAGMKTAMRPESITEDAWDVLWGNFVSQTGSTWGDYVRKMDDNAVYLDKLGLNLPAIQDLLGFEFARADGMNVMGSLASATDARVAASGLPLAFARVFPQSINQRFVLGPLGRGWSHNWDYRLTRTAGGDVTIVGPGGSRRLFQPDSRWGYFARPGDRGTLTNQGGGRYSLREADGTAYYYDASGRLEYIEDTNQNRITCQYSGNQLTGLQHSSGQKLQIAYSGSLIQSVTDPDGRTTIYTYDGEHLTRAHYYDGQEVVYTYNNGQIPAQAQALARIDFPGGSWQQIAYDNLGRLASISSGAGTATFSYDSAGTVIVRDAANHQSSFFMDHRGLVTKTENPLGNTVRLFIDGDYNLTGLTNPAGISTNYAYDAHGRMTEMTDALGNITSFEYAGPYNRLTRLTDAKGNTTRYGYDLRANLASITYANNSMERWDIDAQGNPTGWTNRRGQSVGYTYDAAGRIISKRHDDGSRVNYNYDARGNLVKASDAAGTTTLQYDANDRLTKIFYPGGKWLEFTSDAAGRRASSLDQLGHRLDYHYDTAGRLESMTDEGGHEIVRYVYDAVGRLVRKTVGNGVYTTYEYDGAGQVLHLINYQSNGTILSRFDYAYDSRGRRTSMGMLDGMWAYDYDDSGQLTHAVLASTTTTLPNQDLTYVYDALGNRIRTVENGVATTYTINNMNQYTRVGDTTYVFDTDGNLIRETSLTSGTTTYTYNDENRLVAVSKPSGNWQYQYDAFGDRVATVENGAVTRDVIDPIGLGNVVGEYDGAGNLKAHYDHDFGLLSRRDAAGNPCYYTFDAIGNVQQLVNAAGNIANAYAYVPFGGSINKIEAIPNPFQFVGQFGVMKKGNGMDFMRARHYMPCIGRFALSDPLGVFGGINMNAYCQNNPISYIDPQGHNFDLASIFFVYGNWYGKYNSGGNPKTMTGSIGTLNVGWIDLADRGAKIHDILVYMGVSGASNITCDWFNNEIERKGRIGDELTDDELNMINWFRLATPTKILDQDLVPGIWRTFSEAQKKRLMDALLEAIGKDNALYQTIVGIVQASDPNQKNGPSSYGLAGYLKGDSTLPYCIDFENDTSATAPAQRVDITDTLSGNVDQDTFELTGLGFGDQSITIPPGLQHFEATEKMELNGVAFDVQIAAGLNAATGEVFARFSSLDSKTGLPPTVDIGFLPPEDGTGRGQGYFSYIIKPKAGLPTGTQIRNVAWIVFDEQRAIATNQVDDHNPAAGTDPAKECLLTIDAGAPSSAVQPLASQVTDNRISLSWSGQDDPGGSGVSRYEIFCSDEGSSFTLWRDALSTETSARFTGQFGHHYDFYSVAVDNVGNREAPPAQADATTYIQLTGTVAIDVTPAAATWTLTDSMGTTHSGTGTATLGNIPAGAVTLAWDALTNYDPPHPNPTSSTLIQGQTLSFTGHYTRQMGTVVVDVTPNTASWSFTDGDGMIHNGTGDQTLTGVPTGSIMLTWGALAGYDTPNPNPHTQSLTNGTTVTFTGAYTPHTGTLGIKVTPATAGWSLSGPLALSNTGTTTILHAPVGSYSLAWKPLSGWTPPTPTTVSLTLAKDQVTTFTGTYTCNTCSLTIVSVHGTSSPAIGSHVYTSGTLINASVAGSPELDTTGTTRWVCTGWTAPGLTPSSGSGQSATLVLDRSTTLTWIWQAQYRLATTVTPNATGSVKLADDMTDAEGWYDDGQTVNLWAIPNAGYKFSFWWLDLRGHTDHASLRMDRPHTILAQFVDSRNGTVNWRKYP